MNISLFIQKCALDLSIVPVEIRSMHLPSGRLLYRHQSQMGSVLEFNDGSPRKVMVLDGKYRTTETFGTYGKRVQRMVYFKENTKDNWMINGIRRDAIPLECSSLADTFLNDLWKDSIDQNTAKQNCDRWMKHNDLEDSDGIVGVPAVSYCRSIQVNGTPCDLPNFQTLIRIYCDAEAIDQLDPTIADHPGRALGSKNPNGSWKICAEAFALSSSEYFVYGVRFVNYLGGCNACFKTIGGAVIPVLEL